jgi:hypothetical protein
LLAFCEVTEPSDIDSPGVVSATVCGPRSCNCAPVQNGQKVHGRLGEVHLSALECKLLCGSAPAATNV